MTRIRPEAYDLLGIGLVVGLAAWSMVVAIIRGGNAVPQVGVLFAAAVGYAAGRVAGGRYPVHVAMVVALGVLAAAAGSGASAFSGGALAPPLGYANANGALYALGVAAAAIAATVTDRVSIRRLSALLALVLLGLTVASRSLAAAVLALGVLLAALAAPRLGRWFALVAPLLVVVAIAVTVTVGLTHGSPALPLLERAFSERRAQLWHDAIEITASAPILGVGPARFAETSSTALADADAQWAHSAYLQAAAETGILGVVLFGTLALWIYGALYRSRQDPRLIVIGAAAATAFAVHAAIDYVAHFPAVVITLGILVGLTSSRRLGSACR